MLDSETDSKFPERPQDPSGETTTRVSPNRDAWNAPASSWETGNYQVPGAGENAQDAAPEPPAQVRKSFFSLGRISRDVIIPLVVAFTVAMFTQATVAKPYQIPSGSMLPTIQLGDRVIADRIIYRFHAIERGDIIVFVPPSTVEQDTPFVKRVIGLPGDTVEVRNGKVLVNGEEFVVPAATVATYTRPLERVPEGMLFVLGDNRNESYDSHRWGYVPADNVIGRAEVVYWPLQHIKLLGS